MCASLLLYFKSLPNKWGLKTFLVWLGPSDLPGVYSSTVSSEGNLERVPACFCCTYCRSSFGLVCHPASWSQNQWKNCPGCPGDRTRKRPPVPIGMESAWGSASSHGFSAWSASSSLRWSSCRVCQGQIKQEWDASLTLATKTQDAVWCVSTCAEVMGHRIYTGPWSSPPASPSASSAHSACLCLVKYTMKSLEAQNSYKLN